MSNTLYQKHNVLYIDAAECKYPKRKVKACVSQKTIYFYIDRERRGGDRETERETVHIYIILTHTFFLPLFAGGGDVRLSSVAERLSPADFFLPIIIKAALD